MKAGAVIVNYNCAPYAIDAALSILGDDPNATVVIVDNASPDNSRDYFKDVFTGKRNHTPIAPSVESNGSLFAPLENLSCEILPQDSTPLDHAQLTVLCAKQNKGFAAGSNLGVRFLQEQFDPDFFLLLNPDAIVAAGALDAFRARLGDLEAGLCGASVLRFEDPDCAQAFGGARLNPLTLLGDNIGAGKPLDAAPDVSQVEAAMTYPLGAAMAFRKDYLEIAGYLDERFFLYYEEADWARRGLPTRKPVWARDAVVYHRHGAVAGSRQSGGGRSALSDYHMARSRMRYALKWRPAAAPIMIMLSLLQSARRLLRGRWRQARAVLTAVIPGASPP